MCRGRFSDYRLPRSEVALLSSGGRLDPYPGNAVGGVAKVLPVAVGTAHGA